MYPGIVVCGRNDQKLGVNAFRPINQRPDAARPDGAEPRDGAEVAEVAHWPVDGGSGHDVQGRRHGFFSGGTNRRQCGQPTPKYPKSRKRQRFWS